MNHSVEIALTLNGVSEFEYFASSVPRVGDFLSISHEDVSGSFRVSKVTHCIYGSKKSKDVYSYVEVEGESVTEK